MKRRRGQSEKHPRAETKRVEQEALASSSLAPSSSAEMFASYVRPAILTLATALLVATPLISSESVIRDGSGSSFHVMWLALAGLSLVGSAFVAAPQQRWSWADLCVAVLVGWHLVSAYFCDGNQRHAWNAAWQWAAYGAIAIIFRQQLTFARETRALVAVLIALAVAVSLEAYFQYGYSQPLRLAEFEKDKEAVFQLLEAPAGTPQRSQAESRIRSVEPLAEFALTNTLAGYLLPWMLMALALAFWSVQRGESGKTTITLLLVAALMAGVLVLTKSRTAWLAAAGGCGLILLFGRRSGWQIDWRWPAGLAAVVLVIGLVAVATKGLDAEVLSESPKSVLYRLEYWRATAALIADEPLVGVGPGNFQERYVNHKLPQASETIADPHNFLLEVWSTAGTPALLALLALMFTTAWQLSSQPGQQPGRHPGRQSPLESATEAAEEQNSDDEELKIGHFAIYAGAVVGLLLAAILGFITFDYLQTTRVSTFDQNAALGLPIIWLTGFAAYILCYFGLKDWVDRGELPKSAAIIALLALLVNLLAAGAAIYPGVVNAAWLLWAIALAREESTETVISPARAADGKQPWDRWQLINVAAATVVALLLVGCYLTEYLPIAQSRPLLMQALESRNKGSVRESERLHEEAIAADPWSPDPWQSLAAQRLGVWLQQPADSKSWKQFDAALQKFIQASPHHYTTYEQQGTWLLLAARRTKEREKLQSAAEAFAAATRCYPNSAFLHAQLAFVYAEQDRQDDARREADEAARLDALCPHQELKLEKRVLHDPQWNSQAAATKPKYAADVVAEIRGLKRPDSKGSDSSKTENAEYE